MVRLVSSARHARLRPPLQMRIERMSMELLCVAAGASLVMWFLVPAGVSLLCWIDPASADLRPAVQK